MFLQERRNTLSFFIILFLFFTLFGIASPARAKTYIGALADCGTPATPISSIQGNGASSPEVGSIHTIEGIVVGDYQTSSGLKGFFVQEESSDHDSDPTTSEGIFIYDGDSPATDVSTGDVVRLTGEVAEYYGLTEVVSYSSKTICSSGNATSPITINMPVITLDTWEQHEGMLIHIPQTLYVTGNAFQGRHGEVMLSSSGRLFNPTSRVEPGAAANARQLENDLNLIQLDDSSTIWYPDPTPYLGEENTLRSGDTLEGLSGVLNFANGVFEVQPTGPIPFNRTNPRPSSPSLDPNHVTVASFNTLSYFSTIDTGPDICGPAQDQGCRGADSNEELIRQRTKIINTIIAMGADIVGLMEIENHPQDEAVIDLVTNLNTIAGAGTYASIDTGPIGIDVIKVALIYKSEKVTPLGGHLILNNSIDPTYVDSENRPSLIQTFTEVSSEEIFTLAVSHLKSKGSPCDGIGDSDTGDGQGNCNLTRTAGATALAKYLFTDPTSSTDMDFLIIGDLNAYAKEDPIDVLKNHGFYDLIERYLGPGAYSYVYDGQAGYLDHALASFELKLQLAGIQQWHINADEPSALDYNDYNPTENYSSDHFRATDHDPLLVSFNLGQAPTVIDTTPEDGNNTNQDITSIKVNFSKEVIADGSANAADNPFNYLLLDSQGDDFQTKSCASGFSPSDTPVSIDSADYDPVYFSATIAINASNPLPEGEYKFFVCGTTSITDLKGRKLNDGTFDTVTSFTVNDPAIESSTSNSNPENVAESQASPVRIPEPSEEEIPTGKSPTNNSTFLPRAERSTSWSFIKSVRIYLR